jgi:hypothetical protein
MVVVDLTRPRAASTRRRATAWRRARRNGSHSLGTPIDRTLGVCVTCLASAAGFGDEWLVLVELTERLDSPAGASFNLVSAIGRRTAPVPGVGRPDLKGY